MSAFGRSKMSTTFAATSATESELDEVPYLRAGGAGRDSVRRSAAVRSRRVEEGKRGGGKKRKGKRKKTFQHALSEHPCDDVEEQVGEDGLLEKLDEVFHGVLARLAGGFFVVVAVRDEVHQRVPVGRAARREG